MQEFISIDFETANPKRVSACALGYVKVSNCEIVEKNGYLIKPGGGLALKSSLNFENRRKKKLVKPCGFWSRSCLALGAQYKWHLYHDLRGAYGFNRPRI